jgi:REP element-mobilizing transposase RayT
MLFGVATAHRLSGEPLAYFLTFAAYGDRLHGDGRGTVDATHKAFGMAQLPENKARQVFESRRRSNQAVAFSAEMRHTIEHAIRETCAARDWALYALHVRTNHVHLVLAANCSPERAMTSLKAWCTRRMRERLLIAAGEPLWARHGSTRYLWSVDDIEGACQYVEHAQGEALP